jgi:hypothetical protein
VREVVELEKLGDLALVVIRPGQLRDVWLRPLVEIVGTAMRAEVEPPAAGGAPFSSSSA